RYAVQRGAVKEAKVLQLTQLAVLLEEAWHSGSEDPYFWTSVDRGIKPATALFYDGHVRRLEVDFVTGTNNIENYDIDWWFNGPGVDKNGGWDLDTDPRDVR